MENQPPVLVDHEQAGRAVFQRLPKLPLVLGDLRLALRQCGDVIDPQDALAADEADVTAAIGDLRIRDEDVQQPAALILPDRFLVEELTAALAQRFDDPRPLREILPEQPGIEERKLLLLVAEKRAEPLIVEEQPAVLVDDQEGGRAIFEELPELTLLLGDLGIAGRQLGDRRGLRRLHSAIVGHRHGSLAPSLPGGSLAPGRGQFDSLDIREKC